jgi:hypothetical protein
MISRPEAISCAYLYEVIHAGRAPSRVSRAQRRQKHCNQHTDDEQHNNQFNDCERRNRKPHFLFHAPSTD